LDYTPNATAANRIVDVNGNEMAALDAEDVELIADVSPPVVQTVTALSANDVYHLDDTIDIAVKFNEAVLVDASGGNPRIALNVNDTTRYAVYNGSGSGTDTLEFSYTVQRGDEAADLAYNQVTSLKLNGGTIEDVLGTNAILDLPTPGATGSLSKAAAIEVDGIVPVLELNEDDSQSSAATAGTYQVIFKSSETLVVNGGTLSKDDFTATTDGNPNVVDSVSLSSDGLTLTIVLQNYIPNGEAVTVSYALNADLANQLVDQAGNVLAAFSNRSITVTNDNVKPLISSFTTDKTDGSYNAGETITIFATMTENVRAGSSFDATLNSGGSLTLTAASDGLTLTGTYTVGAADSTESTTSGLLRVSSFTYDPGDVKDLAGNLMISTTLPATNLNTASSVVIDNQIFPILDGGETIKLTTNIGDAALLDAGDVLTFNFLEEMTQIDGSGNLESYFENTDLFGVSGTRAEAVVSNNGKTVTVTLGAGETLDLDATYTLPNVEDLAGNVANITFIPEL